MSTWKVAVFFFERLSSNAKRYKLGFIANVTKYWTNGKHHLNLSYKTWQPMQDIHTCGES